MTGMEATAVDFSLMFGLGLVSSLHCVTMCGPIIAVATAPIATASPRSDAGRPPRRWLALAGWQASYNLGRGLSYIGLGAVLGWANTTIGALFPARQVGSAIQLTVGALLIILTLYVLVAGRAVSAPKSGTVLGRLVARLVTARRGTSVFTLGFFTGFLPCGVLYAAFARALTATSAAEGCTLMLAFWVGTLPLLFTLGFATGGFFRLVGRRLANALIAMAMLGTGGWLVYKGGRGLGHANEHGSHTPARTYPSHHADR